MIDKNKLRLKVIEVAGELIANNFFTPEEIDTLLEVLREQPAPVWPEDWKKLVPDGTPNPMPYKPMEIWYGTGHPNPNPVCTTSSGCTSKEPKDVGFAPFEDDFRVQERPPECVSPTPDEIGG